MDYINYRISLDMFDTLSQINVKAKKGDSACRIYITLTENGKIYKIDNDCNATFNAKKSDGNFVNDYCTIEDNTIVYDFSKSIDENGVCQVSACEGAVECEVALCKGTEQLTSPRFTLIIDGTVYNGEDIISSEGDKGDKGDKGDSADSSLIANAVTKTVFGTEVDLSDVSPLPHNIVIKVPLQNLLPNDWVNEGDLSFSESVYDIETKEITNNKIRIKATNNAGADMFFNFPNVVLSEGIYILKGVNVFDTSTMLYDGDTGLPFEYDNTLGGYKIEIPSDYTPPYTRISLYNSGNVDILLENCTLTNIAETGIANVTITKANNSTEKITIEVEGNISSVDVVGISSNVAIETTYNVDTGKAIAQCVHEAVGVNCLKKNQGAENVGKILVVGADGNIMLTDMPISSVVTGTFDENNNIILNGNLADGTYTLKYENPDGTYTEIGTLEIGEVEPEEPEEPDTPSYTNLIPTALADNLTDIYNGTGYKLNYRINSSGEETTGKTVMLIGLLPIGVSGDVFHLRGAYFDYISGSNGGMVALYDENVSFLKCLGFSAFGTHKNDENGDLTFTFNFADADLSSNAVYAKFMPRLANGTTEEAASVILTRNELIPL